MIKKIYSFESNHLSLFVTRNIFLYSLWKLWHTKRTLFCHQDVYTSGDNYVQSEK